jgi:putative endonuclease
MLNDAQQFGRDSEDAAADYLRGAGYRIVTRNYRHRFGEIDLVAYDGPTLVFVEVKARRSERYGSAQEAVTRRKRDQLTKAALGYLAARRSAGASPCRFDLVVIQAVRGQTAPRIDLLKDIFAPTWGMA